MTDQPPVPVFQPHVGLDTIKAVVDALHAGWLGMGAVTQAFEDGLARFLGLDARYVLATNTGTSALHLGLLAAGVSRGDEVVTPAFNFVADHQAIIAAGAAPVFCDVEDATLVRVELVSPDRPGPDQPALPQMPPDRLHDVVAHRQGQRHLLHPAVRRRVALGQFPQPAVIPPEPQLLAQLPQ